MLKTLVLTLVSLNQVKPWWPVITPGVEQSSGAAGRRACQCVISRAGLGGKWHCDGRHRPGWGDLCVSVSSSQCRSSAAHILIGVLLQAPSHCLVTTPQMGTLPHVITITSSYSSIIPVAIAQQYSQSLPCAWIYSIAILSCDVL